MRHASYNYIHNELMFKYNYINKQIRVYLIETQRQTFIVNRQHIILTRVSKIFPKLQDGCFFDFELRVYKSQLIHETLSIPILPI